MSVKSRPNFKKKNPLSHLLNLKSNHVKKKQQVGNQPQKNSFFKVEYFDVGLRSLALSSNKQSSGKGQNASLPDIKSFIYRLPSKGERLARAHYCLEVEEVFILMNWSHQFNCTFDLKTLCAPDNPLSEAVPRGAPSSTALSRQERAIGEILILLCKSQEATFSSSPPRSIPISTQWLPAEEEARVCQHKWKGQSWLLPFDSEGPLQAPNWMLTAGYLSQNHLRPFPKECKRQHKWKSVEVKFRSPVGKADFKSDFGTWISVSRIYVTSGMLFNFSEP